MRRLRGAAVIAVAMGAMNLLTYGYTIAAARLLGPESFGAFSSVMSVLLVVTVLSLGLQATAARRIAADPSRVAETEHAVLRVSAQAAVALGLVCAALAPLLDRVLRLESLPTALLVAATAVPITLMGGQAGVLQGERRWDPLALVYLASGAGRVVIGVGLMVWLRTELAAVLGVALGAWLPVLVGWVVLRHGRQSGRSGPSGVHDLLREVGHSSHALLAFFVLGNADMVLARVLLDERSAGLYAGGLILVKAIVFLPQFVIVMAFPSMSEPDASHRTLFEAMAVVVALGAAAMAGTVLLPDLALAFIGGAEYAVIRDDLWRFALLGTLLCLVQLVLYSILARRHRWAVLVVWAAVTVLLLTAPLADDVRELVTLVTAVDALTLLGLLLVGVRPRRTSSPAPASAGTG